MCFGSIWKHVTHTQLTHNVFFVMINKSFFGNLKQSQLFSKKNRSNVPLFFGWKNGESMRFMPSFSRMVFFFVVFATVHSGCRWHRLGVVAIPIGSMEMVRIFTYIWLQFMVNAGKYTIPTDCGCSSKWISGQYMSIPSIPYSSVNIQYIHYFDLPVWCLEKKTNILSNGGIWWWFSIGTIRKTWHTKTNPS